MKKMLSLSFAILFAFALLVGCKSDADKTTTDNTTTKTTFDLTKAKQEIEAVNKSFSEMVVKSDTAGLANFYTTDAKFMNSGYPAFKGRESIKAAMGGMLKSGISKLDLRTNEVFGNEELLAEDGELTLYVQNKPVSEEKYIVLWKKEDGQWKIFRDIFNSNAPAMPAK